MNIIVSTEDGRRKLNMQKGKSILSLLRKNDIYISSPCGGRGTCGKCKIRVLKGHLPVSEADEKHFSKNELDRGYRLACLAYPAEDLEIVIESSEEGFSIITEFQDSRKTIDSGFELVNVTLDDVDWDKSNSIHLALESNLDISYPLSYKGLKNLSIVLNDYIKDAKSLSLQLLTKDKTVIDVFNKEPMGVYGIAIDIGTTTLGFLLVDLLTGSIEAAHSRLNNQRMYGADVITRIQSAASGNLEELNHLITKDIVSGIESLLQDTGIDKRFVYSVDIAGNTTMQHILLGLSPESLGQFPFTATTLNFVNYNFQNIFKSNFLDCNVTLLPGIDAYVGADIVSGILHHEFFKTEKINMLIDIGTNGEIVIGNKERILCTATAAGPALEGGNISCGVGCVTGAIASVKLSNNIFEYKVVGSQKPIGLCGSGIIDVIAEGLKKGWIDDTGRLSKTFLDGEIIICHENEGGDIKLTQKDIREIQLAKSAIRSGVECLIKEYGINYDDIDNVYLAGGFGSNINIENAVKIGLISEELKHKIKISGNSSLGGTIKHILDKNCTAHLKIIQRITTSLNLSSNLEFKDLFVENMFY